MDEDKNISGRVSKEYLGRQGENATVFNRYDHIFNSFLQHPSVMMNSNSEVDGSFVFAKRSKWADVRVADSYVGADENPLVKESLGNDQFYHLHFGKLENAERLLRERKNNQEEELPNSNSEASAGSYQSGGEKTSIVNKRYLPTLLSSSFVRDENIFLNSVLSPKSCKNFNILMNEATAAEKEKFVTESLSVEGTQLKEPATSTKDPFSRENLIKSDAKLDPDNAHINIAGIARTLFKKDSGEVEPNVESKLISSLKERFNIYKQTSQAKTPSLYSSPPIAEKIETPNGPLHALQKLFTSNDSIKSELNNIFSKTGGETTSEPLRFKKYFGDKRKINFLTSLEDVQEVFDELSVKKSSKSNSIQRPMSFKDSFNENNIHLTQFKASESMHYSRQRDGQKSNQKQPQSRDGTAKAGDYPADTFGNGIKNKTSSKKDEDIDEEKVDVFEFAFNRSYSERVKSPGTGDKMGSNQANSNASTYSLPFTNIPPIIFQKEKMQNLPQETPWDTGNIKLNEEELKSHEESSLKSGSKFCATPSCTKSGIDVPAPKRIYLKLEASVLKKGGKNQLEAEREEYSNINNNQTNFKESDAFRLQVENLKKQAQNILANIKPLEETNLKKDCEEKKRMWRKDCSFGGDPKPQNLFENSFNQTSIPTAHSVAHQDSETSLLLQKLLISSGRETGISIPESERVALNTSDTNKKGQIEGNLKIKSLKEIEKLEKLILSECNDLRKLRNDPLQQNKPGESQKTIHQSSGHFKSLKDLEDDLRDIPSISKKATVFEPKNDCSGGEFEMPSKNSNISFFDSFGVIGGRGNSYKQESREILFQKLIKNTSPMGSNEKKKSKTGSCFKYIGNFETPNSKQNHSWIKKNVIERNEEWLLAKKRNEKEKREASELKEVSECTFRPSTSRMRDTTFSGRKAFSKCYTPQRFQNFQEAQIVIRNEGNIQNSKKESQINGKSIDLNSARGSLSAAQQKYDKTNTFKDYYANLDKSGSYKKKYQLRKIIGSVPIFRDFNVFTKTEH